MTAVFYTADTHFTHKMVAGLRGFGSSEEHDEAIVANWNTAVSRDDTVWHLGDAGLGKPAAILPWVSRLNGTIHLITGNHDAVWPAHRDAHRHQREWLERFASVQSFARRKIAGHYVLLSHFPYEGGGDHTETERYPQYRLPDLGMWLLHGHTHGKERQQGRMIHVGLDAWDLQPVPQHEIERILNDSGR